MHMYMYTYIHIGIYSCHACTHTPLCRRLKKTHIYKYSYVVYIYMYIYPYTYIHMYTCILCRRLQKCTETLKRGESKKKGGSGVGDDTGRRDW